jgi:predicted nucleic acid-binding protein
MILVDTSVWIRLMRGGLSIKRGDLIGFATCGPVIQEVFAGLRETRQSQTVRRAFRAMQSLSDPVPVDLFVEASEIFRHGRRKGITIRSSFDCLIAAIAIENEVPVWHADRDFDAIGQFTRLRVHRPN